MVPFLGGDGPFDPLDFKTGLIFWSAITYGILLLILWKKGWGPLRNSIEERERKIAQDIEDAEKARAEAQASMAEYQRKLDEAALEARTLVDEARETAERAKTSIVEEARAEAEKLKQQAARDIEAARDKAMAEIKDRIVEVAMAVSEKVVSASADQAEHERLCNEMLTKAGGLN